LSKAPVKVRTVTVVVMENTSYDEALQLPFVHALARRCGLATDYHAVTHPSLGNYLALTSGNIPPGMSGTDCSPGPGCTSGAQSIFGQMGSSWRVWAENMPRPCASSDSGLYAVRHTAAPYYTRLRSQCPAHQVDLSSAGDGLAATLRAGRLPRFGLVVPNLRDDMHNGCRPCGDRWLRRWVGAFVDSQPYRSGSAALFVTWDEDDGGSGNRVPLIVVSRDVRPGTVVTAPLDHYALLRAFDQLLGEPPLGRAASAPPGLAAAFGLR
jgi:phosphatidylinositol-3-phosphatase